MSNELESDWPSEQSDSEEEISEYENHTSDCIEGNYTYIF